MMAVMKLCTAFDARTHVYAAARVVRFYTSYQHVPTTSTDHYQIQRVVCRVCEQLW